MTTTDEIRSLAISQRSLGTEEIVLIHHADRGMLAFTDNESRNSIQQETGTKPEWAAQSFSDLETDMRQSIARVKAKLFPRKDSAHGFDYESPRDGCARSRLVRLPNCESTPALTSKHKE